VRLPPGGKAPAIVETERLVLRRPAASDAEAIFTRYASDPDVTKFVGWATHRSIEHTRVFLAFSDAEWDRWPAGPYLIHAKGGALLLGGTGLAFETPDRAMTGYVLARDAWGRGYATECMHAMIDVARQCGIRELYALCHTDHAASWRVLEKCGLTRERVLPRHSEFPNLTPGVESDVYRYELAL
jgi:RimJ/RimL family protein N-acetyltransferase